MSNPADPDIFITAARKLTVFLSDKRAYYAEAQQPIVEILEIACNSLKNAAPNVFIKGSLDRSAIPADKAPLFEAFNKLASSVTPYISLFADATLTNRLILFLSSVGISLPGGTTNVPPRDTPSQMSATPSTRVDPMASQARSPSPIEIPSPEIMALSLPSAKGATSFQPTTLPTSAPDRLPSLEAKGSGNGAVVQIASNRPATQSPVGELRAPVSGDVVKSTRVEHNQDVPVPTPSSSQKMPDNTSVTPSPASANLTSQGHNLRSISSGQVGVAQVSQSQSVPTPHVTSPVQTSASVPLISTSSGQNEPRPPRRRQSSGLDFLQLDLQVARQRKLMAAKQTCKAQKSGTVQASPGAVPSPPTKDGPSIATVSPTSTTIASLPNTPAALTSTPTIPTAAQATPVQTPGTTQAPISVITTGVSNTTSQPQMIQTASPTLVHRDLRQGSSRVRTSGASPRKLRITDRAPAPAPEPGSSGAPIVIDEEDVIMSTPADESLDVDTVMQPPTQTEETPMALDSDPQKVQGSNGDAKDDHKPQHDQEVKALSEQQAQLEQSKDHRKVADDSVEGLGPSNNDIGSGATIIPPLGNESPVLSNSKDSIHTAVGVISVPKGKDTEMTPSTTTATVSTAVATEPSAVPDHSTISAQSVVVGSNSPGTTLGLRPSIPSGKASVSTPLGHRPAPHSSIGSFSDMDISFTSDTPPPIVVLGTRASHSRSTSPHSGKRSSEGGTEPVKAEEIEEDASEMVDELAPLFGKEMKVICMDRAYDVPGEFTWNFTLSHADWDRVSRWAKAPENLDSEISQARCITLACYLMQELDLYATQDGLLREQWFENVKPIPWVNLPRNLWALINDDASAMFPPYSSPDDLFDLSPFLRVGRNRITFTQIDGMAEYVLVLHGHRPTRGQLVPLKARWDQERYFRERLSLLSRPFIIDDW